jgi:hypothetical protein
MCNDWGYVLPELFQLRDGSGYADDMGPSNLVRSFQLAQQNVDLHKRIGLQERGLVWLHAGHSWTRMQRARDGSGTQAHRFVWRIGTREGAGSRCRRVLVVQ